MIWLWMLINHIKIGAMENIQKLLVSKNLGVLYDYNW